MTSPEEIAREAFVNACTERWHGLTLADKEFLETQFDAALAASEQRVKGLENEKETIRLWLVSAETKLQASERALERVKKDSVFFAEKWRWFLKEGEKFHESFLADVAALASPGSPQEQ